MLAKNHDHQNFVLLHALDAAKTALARGTIDENEMALIAALATLGVEPPKTSRDKDPLVLNGCDAVPGSWDQYVEACFRAYRGNWDLNALDRCGDPAAKKRKAFFTHVLNATIRGASVALQKTDALPRVRPPLTADRLCGIFHDAIDKNEDKEQELLEAVTNAARWVVRCVLLPEYRDSRITRNELAELSLELRDAIEDEDLPGDAGRKLFKELLGEQVTTPASVSRPHATSYAPACATLH